MELYCKVRITEDYSKGFRKNPYVYFVHSYYLQAEDEEIVKRLRRIWCTHIMHR